MQKLKASLPNITVAALNGLMSWGISQLPGKSDLKLDTNIVLVVTIVAVILVGFLSNQSTNSSSPGERNNLPWLAGLVPMIGSGVLLGLLKSGYVPTNLTQYVGFAFLVLFILGAILPVVIVGLDVWWGNKSAAPVNGGTDSRQVLLNVMKTEVAKRLQDSLHYQTKIDLLTEDQPELVNRPQNLKPLKPKNKPKWNLWSFLGKTQTEVPETEKVINIFNRTDIAGRLLILGEPGSGKTTTLLELAEDLLAKTKEPNNQNIPFIFELSSWKEDKLSIADWLATDLKSRFKIPESQTKNWIKTGQLLPLLDGLDELGLTQQTQCIMKIDQCLQEHPDLQVAVCCRVQEYQTGEVNFEKLRWAICIQPLTDAQIENYLKELNRADLWQSIQTDTEGLLKLAKIPLLLHLIPVAYPEGYLQPNLGRQRHNQQYLEDSRNQLLAAYIDRQLEKKHSRYSAKDTKRWLEWLARQLRERNQTEFLLEKMQPDLLGSSKYKLLYRLSFGLISGLSFGLIFGLVVGLVVGLSCGLSFGLIFGLSFGLIYGLIFGLIDSKINPVETISWKTQRFTINLIGGLIYGLTYGLTYGLISGLIIGLIGGLIFGLIGDEIRVRNKPNQGIIESAKSAVILTLVVFPLTVLLFYSLSNLKIAWSFPLITGLGMALFFGIFLGGGMAVIQHYTLRFVLWCSGAIPLNYVDFLSYAAERRLIQQVGGRYRFIHDLLREYLAGVQPWRSTCTLTGHADIVWDVALSPDGKTIASASNDNTVKLWRLSADGQASLLHTYTKHTAPVNCVAFTPDCKILVSGSDDKTLKIWDISIGNCHTLTEHSDAVGCVAITADGTHLASGSRDGVVKIWHLPTRQLIHTIAAHSLALSGLAFTPDGQILVSGGQDKSIKVWETATGKLIRTIIAPSLTNWWRWLDSSKVYSVAINPDGKTLVSSSAEEAVEIWHLDTGKRHRKLSVHLKRQWKVGISPDWQIIAGIGENGMIRLHHFPTGKLICVMNEHSANVNSIVFSQDGQFIVSGSEDNTIKIWQQVPLSSQTRAI